MWPCLVAFVAALRESIFGTKAAKSAHLSSVLRKKVCCNGEIEDTVDRTPAYELDEKFERRLRDHPSDPSRGQYKKLLDLMMRRTAIWGLALHSVA